MPTIDTPALRLREQLTAVLDAETRGAVAAILDRAAGSAVYAVGGTVRDLLLGRPLVDIDLVTGADAIDLVRAAFPNARLTTHAAFRTASLEVGGTWLDVATARTETYDHPGALPRVVAPASIDEDLARRDFAINAIALRLDGEPALIDPHGGVDDLAAHRVRVLHGASFRDDATRILRAFRYATRLGFEIESHTRAQIERDLDCLHVIGAERFRRELELTLGEATGGAALVAMAAAGVLGTIHPALTWDEKRSSALAVPAKSGIDRAAFGFALLAADCATTEANALIERLRLTRHEADAVRSVPSLRTAAAMLRRPEAKPSGVAVLLDRFPIAAVAAYAARPDDAIAGQLALRYLAEWRAVKPILDGNDLIEMGIPEGPQVARGLQLLRASRLDGWATNRDDERALIMRFAKSIRDSTAKHGTIDLRFHVN